MTPYEIKKIIYETIMQEIDIDAEVCHRLTEIIYRNLKAGQ